MSEGGRTGASCSPQTMRVWVDITDASHVVFFAPIVRRLESAGHTVTVTARRFAGADVVLSRYGLGGVLTTGHRGGNLGTRAVGLVNRTAQLVSSAASGRFDVAAGSHASDFVLAAWTLAIPQMTFLDDERVRRIDALNLRLVDEVAVPDAVQPAALTDAGATPAKLFRYPGFKEEYYLYDFRPDRDAVLRLGVDRRSVVGVVRPPRAARRESAGGAAAARAAAAILADDERPLADLVRELARRRNVTIVLLARDAAQRDRFVAHAGTSVIAPVGLVDGASVLAAADFVLGAGGVMMREAAALGTPAYTLAWRSPSTVEAALLTDGRLRPVTGADDIALKKKARPFSVDAAPRDPGIFVARLAELASHTSRRARLGRLARDVGAGEAAPLV